MKKYLLALTITLTVLLTGCGNKSDKIIVLTSAGYEPYEMIDDSGELIGFDIDLMKAVAEEIGIEIEFKNVDFDGIVASLQSYKADIAIAGITPTEERAKVIDFSDIYFNEQSGLENHILLKNTYQYTSLDDLNGLVLGAQIGTVQAEILNEMAPLYNFTVELRNTNTQLLQDIMFDKISGIVVEKLVADSILENNDFLNDYTLNYDSDLTLGNAIALSKGSNYKEDINKALQTLKENGTIDSLVTKWFN